MFARFPSITNTYKEIDLFRWRSVYPNLDSLTYVVTEKLHGTNLQFIFDKDKYGDVVVLATRGHVLKPNESHYGAVDVFGEDKYQIAAERVQADAGTNQVNLYAELFGGKIMKGIVYGEKQIRFIGVRINGILLSYSDLRRFFEDKQLDPDHYLAPFVAVVDGLEKALDYNVTNLVSKMTPPEATPEDFHVRNPKNLAEGVVISPVNQTIEHRGKIFLLKKKNEWATEKLKEKKPRVPISKPIVRLRQEFENYITPARIEAAFSKYGRHVEQYKDFQIFIPMILQDAKKDFEEDWGDQIKNLTLSPEEKKFLYNVGGKIADLLYIDLGEK